VRRPRTIKLPPELEDAFERLRQPGGPFADYPSFNAAIVALVLYSVAFPRRHTLTAGIARMCDDDQAIIHAFILTSLERGDDLRTLLPKPASAKDLLDLAKAPRR
jgi:hypothetical protein